MIYLIQKLRKISLEISESKEVRYAGDKPVNK